MVNLTGESMKILVMGLPGSGKTTLARVLAEKLGAAYFNADEVRKMFNDWDFSDVGRHRQANRMYDLARAANTEHVVADFVCPTLDTRMLFDPDFIVFMNTIQEGRFEDTNKMFERPEAADVEITAWGDVNVQVDAIVEKILTPVPEFDFQKPTGLMIGRFQPFHDGHVKLFETILEKEGQVLIGVRDTFNTDEKNPFNFLSVANFIDEKLQHKYEGKYRIQYLPNITGVYYGRDVGYKVEQIHLGAEIESISATDIRKKMAEQQNASS
jgi:adenylylsulfate kinase